MTIECIVQDSKGTLYNLSRAVRSVTVDTTLIEQPGKLSLAFIKEKDVSFNNGSVIRLKVNGMKVFYGYVFTQAKSDKNTVSITAYDGLRYLQNKDIYVTSKMSSSDIFRRICRDQKLPHTVVDSSKYKVAPKLHDNKTYYEILQYALDMTLVNTGNWYIIRDNFGKLEHINLAGLKTDLVIGDKSLLSGYQYEHSIDSDTYNQVKLVKEIKSEDGKETAGREVYIVKSGANIQKWGLLQYFEKVDDKMNKAQVIERAEQLLRIKNRETKSLKIECLGDFRVRAGNGVVLSIGALKGEAVPYNKYVLVSDCTHKITNDIHTMSLTLEVV